MSTTEIVLISIGGLGYLLIGWVATIVFAAMYPNNESYKGPRARSGWWLCVPLWPVVIFGSGVVWLLVHVSSLLGKVTLRQVRRLNPEIVEEEWYA